MINFKIIHTFIVYILLQIHCFGSPNLESNDIKTCDKLSTYSISEIPEKFNGVWISDNFDRIQLADNGHDFKSEIRRRMNSNDEKLRISSILYFSGYYHKKREYYKLKIFSLYIYDNYMGKVNINVKEIIYRYLIICSLADKDYISLEKYTKTALEIGLYEKDMGYEHLAESYYYLGEYNKALDYINLSMEIIKKDRRSKLYNKIISKLFFKEPKSYIKIQYLRDLLKTDVIFNPNIFFLCNCLLFFFFPLFLAIRDRANIKTYIKYSLTMSLGLLFVWGANAGFFYSQGTPLYFYMANYYLVGLIITSAFFLSLIIFCPELLTYKNLYYKKIKHSLLLKIFFIICVVVIYFAGDAIALFSKISHSNAMIDMDIFNRTFLILESLIFAPIIVEFIFRISLANLILNKFRFTLYSCISSLSFVFWDGSQGDLIYNIKLFICGLLFCAIYRISKTCFPIIILHFLIGSIGCIAYGLIEI